MDTIHAQEVAFYSLAAFTVTIVVIATLGSWYWLQDKLGFFWSLGLMLLFALTAWALFSLV